MCYMQDKHSPFKCFETFERARQDMGAAQRNRLFAPDQFMSSGANTFEARPGGELSC